MLTSEQLEQFDRDGFLVIPDFFTKNTAQELLNQAKLLLKNFDLAQNPKTRFTSDEDNHVGDEWFLRSGDKIRFFFENDAFNKDGELIIAKEQSINKIGHGLHILDNKFKKFSTSDKVVGLVKDLGFEKPHMLQSMLICKQPKIGAAVGGHVDSTFLYTNPPSCIGFWFALEDCTRENGCMWFAPGSHKVKRGLKRFVRNKTNSGTEFIKADEDVNEPKDEEYVCKETKEGTLVLIHGLVYHKSAYNLSEKSRFIYTFHVIEGKNEYPKNNWLQPTKEHPFMNLYEQKEL